MRINKTTLELINNTPLVRLDKITADFNLYAKLEFIQPGGSVKDRAALQIIIDAYENGKLIKGQTVVEMTSGNMGAGLAVVCKQFGNPFVAVMSEGNSPERLKILKALGAEVLLTKQVDGNPGMVTGKDIEYADIVAKEYTSKVNGFYVDQFHNISCINAHYNTTGPEIYSELPIIDAFLTGIGTGATYLGASKFLKFKNNKILCIVVEPENAAILKTGKVIDPKHIIQGTSYSLVPPHWDKSLADDFITVTDDEVIEMTKRISTEQGLFVGYSSGANVMASIKLNEKYPHLNNIVTVLCDIGYKYSF